MTIRQIIASLLEDEAQLDAFRLSPEAFFADLGFGDLAGSMVGEAFVHFSDAAPLALAEAVSPIATYHSSIPFESEDLPEEWNSGPDLDPFALLEAATVPIEDDLDFDEQFEQNADLLDSAVTAKGADPAESAERDRGIDLDDIESGAKDIDPDSLDNHADDARPSESIDPDQLDSLTKSAAPTIEAPVDEAMQVQDSVQSPIDAAPIEIDSGESFGSGHDAPETSSFDMAEEEHPDLEFDDDPFYDDVTADEVVPTETQVSGLEEPADADHLVDSARDFVEHVVEEVIEYTGIDPSDLELDDL